MEQYAIGRLLAALASAAAAPDPALRERAAGKVDRWRAVLAGMQSGELTIGSRTPVADTPAWVTLDVVHGGFATGRFLAEQPLDAAEQALLARIPTPGSTDRERLNLWYLGDAGQAELRAALAADRYRVELPEHAALLTVVLLLDRGHPEAALDLVAELRPLLHRLRFTPLPTHLPAPGGTSVHLRSAGEVAGQLRAATVNPRIAAMRTTLGVWQPLVDELVELWAGTVEDGWPARRFLPDWAARRDDWLARWAAAGPPAGRHHHPRSTATVLRLALAKPELTARDVGRLRQALAATLAKRARADRPAVRAAQAAVVAAPTHAERAHAVADRLGRYPAGAGIPSVEEVAGDAPPAVAAKAARALEAPVGELVARGVVGSGEVLARVLPQVTAHYTAAGIPDPLAAGLYARTYAAFRRRRSLLLLDLAAQVRFEELPWVAALFPFRVADEAGAAAAREALADTALLALTAFPATILPNPLLVELRALADRAGLRLPLVEELAADIFTGTFTFTWRHAAALASAMLAGTLYAAYYDLPADWPAAPPVPRRRLWRREPAPRADDDFAERCRDRAREAGPPDGGVAANGAVLEQAQILTTQNLAVLTAGLGLADRWRELGADADRGLHRAVRLLDRLPAERLPRLRAVKNAAYAWRQALFFLSWVEPAEQLAALHRLEEVTADGPLWPATTGLRHVLHGGRFAPDGTAPGGRRLLGWSVGPHWLLTPPG